MKPRLAFLVLMLTGRCNLSCAYCYAGAGQGGRDMTPETAELAIERFHEPGQPLVVELAGGEPLLAWNTLSGLVGKYATRPGLRFALQTNGLLLNAKKLGFLADHGVGLGLSLDGVPAINDRLRGAGAKVQKALNLLNQSSLGVNLTTVLTSRNIDTLPEFLLAMAGHPSIRVVNLDLVRDLGRASSLGLSPTEGQIEAMVPRMLETLAFINSRRWPQLKVREVEQVRKRSAEQEVQPYCLACEGRYAALTPQGDLFSCSSLLGIQRYKLGNLKEDANIQLPGPNPDWDLPDECRACEVRLICRGGCPARRIATTGSPQSKSPTECQLRRAIYKGMTP